MSVSMLMLKLFLAIMFAIDIGNTQGDAFCLCIGNTRRGIGYGCRMILTVFGFIVIVW